MVSAASAAGWQRAHSSAHSPAHCAAVAALAAFDAIVPELDRSGCVLVVLQPFISKRLAIRRARIGLMHQCTADSARGLAVAFTGVYGGYFGAAQACC
jgi:hypothetical protein